MKSFDVNIIPDLSGKVILVIGGTAGIGKIMITALVKHNPSHIFFSGRDARKANQVVDAITAAVPGAQVTFIKCDLASLASIDEAARQLISAIKRLDILICNAGIMAVPLGLIVDGYEI